MRKYYLFLIKEKYLDEPEYLIYKIMDNLYHLRDNDFNYGISCYNQLCGNFNVELLNNYVKNKFDKQILTRHSYQYVIHLKTESCLIRINTKFMIVVSNKNMSILMKYLNCYSHNIFVCDFQNKDYFWLHKYFVTNKITN